LTTIGEIEIEILPIGEVGILPVGLPVGELLTVGEIGILPIEELAIVGGIGILPIGELGLGESAGGFAWPWRNYIHASINTLIRPYSANNVIRHKVYIQFNGVSRLPCL